MFNLFQIADACQGIGPVVRIIKIGVFPIFQIGIPIILIMLGTIDLGRAVMSSDDKEVKAAQSRLIKRCIYAVAVFFVVTLVHIVMNLVATGAAHDDVDDVYSTDWWTCWESV